MKTTLSPAVDSVSMYYDAGTDEYGNVTLRYRRNRLVKRSRQYKWQGDCHVYLNVTGGQVLLSDIAVTHKKVRHSAGRALSIYAKRIERGDTFTPRDFFYYGNELKENGKYQEAIASYERNLSLPNGWIEDKIFACINMSDCYRSLRNYNQALAALWRSFHHSKPKPEALSRLGYLFYLQRQYATAIYWYDLATRHEPDASQWSFSYPAYSTWYPHLHMGICYYNLGDYEKAYAHNEQARTFRPGDRHILHNKAVYERKLGEINSTA
ncbi:hypothetical protein XYCOK13_35610 [Xylanibacillus composti]|uniref:Tetratricopeptide repeat protein n=1 Tax=Xylanibacillus composti TaxID=1572762 RepID=A0A8J4H6R2_9BACL|nr:hypothetical protein XYCOK13_35610 [Xylanibacillus composti]